MQYNSPSVQKEIVRLNGQATMQYMAKQFFNHSILWAIKP
jgi:hypothetical protein